MSHPLKVFHTSAHWISLDSSSASLCLTSVSLLNWGWWCLKENTRLRCKIDSQNTSLKPVYEVITHIREQNLGNDDLFDNVLNKCLLYRSSARILRLLHHFLSSTSSPNRKKFIFIKTLGFLFRFQEMLNVSHEGSWLIFWYLIQHLNQWNSEFESRCSAEHGLKSINVGYLTTKNIDNSCLLGISHFSMKKLEVL